MRYIACTPLKKKQIPVLDPVDNNIYSIAFNFVASFVVLVIY